MKSQVAALITASLMLVSIATSARSAPVIGSLQEVNTAANYVVQVGEKAYRKHGLVRRYGYWLWRTPQYRYYYGDVHPYQSHNPRPAWYPPTATFSYPIFW
jgi:hypothetical protein